MKAIFGTISIILATLLPAQPDTINKLDAQGKKHGVWKKRHKNNHVYRYSGQFKHGTPYGTFKYYYKDGAIKSVMKFSNNGVLARSTTFWENGLLLSKGNYINQKKDSTWIYYDSDGYLNKAEEYDNGKLDGWRVIYYRAENKEKQAPVKEEVKFDNGKMTGMWKKYYKSGEIEAKGRYKNGDSEGSFEYFYKNGLRKKTEMYKNGKKHGFFVYFDTNEEVIKKDFYWEGRRVEGKERKRLEKKFNEKNQN